LDALEGVLESDFTGMDEQPLASFAQQEELRHHLLADVSRHLLGSLSAQLVRPLDERLKLRF
jgi:hypothetical protein